MPEQTLTGYKVELSRDRTSWDWKVVNADGTSVATGYTFDHNRPVEESRQAAIEEARAVAHSFERATQGAYPIGHSETVDL